MSFSWSVTHRARSALPRAKRMTIAWSSGLARPPTQLFGSFAPVSPSISARATMPCRNSSGNVASDASSTPSARSPFQVKATVTHRFSLSTDERMASTESTVSMIPVSHARPAAAFRNVRNSYRPFSAGARVSRMCWMSSNSSKMRPRWLLHLIEHIGECRLELERLFDFIGGDIRILAVFEEAWALVLTHKRDEGRRIRFPVGREPFQILENCVHASQTEKCYRVFRVFIEVRVKDALIHEVGLTFNWEEHPAQIVKLEHGEQVGLASKGCLELLRVPVKDVFPPGNDLCDDRETVTCRRPGKDRTVSSLLDFVGEEAAFRDGHCCGFRPVVFF